MNTVTMYQHGFFSVLVDIQLYKGLPFDSSQFTYVSKLRDNPDSPVSVVPGKVIDLDVDIISITELEVTLGIADTALVKETSIGGKFLPYFDIRFISIPPDNEDQFSERIYVNVVKTASYD